MYIWRPAKQRGVLKKIEIDHCDNENRALEFRILLKARTFTSSITQIRVVQFAIQERLSFAEGSLRVPPCLACLLMGGVTGRGCFRLNPTPMPNPSGTAAKSMWDCGRLFRAPCVTGCVDSLCSSGKRSVLPLRQRLNYFRAVTDGPGTKFLNPYNTHDPT